MQFKKSIALIITVCMIGTSAFVGGPVLSEKVPAAQKVVGDTEAYAASYNPLKPINYKATGNQRKDMVGFAKTQIGYTERGSNNTYFGSWFGLNHNPWCAMFICWCAYKSGVPASVIPRLAAADRGWAKKQGVYHKSKYWGENYIPKAGDLIYFSWGSRDWADHIGMVSGTGKSGGKTYVYTIEGNKHDKVKTGSYAIDNRYILGYASPKYRVNGTTAKSTTKKTTKKATTKKTTTKPTTTKPLPNTYTLKYRDGLAQTEDEDKIIRPITGTFGKDLTISTYKFSRSGYDYNSWYVYREVKNKLVYLVRDKSGKTEKWVAYNSVPSGYTRITVSCGKTLKIKTKVTGPVYISPVWEKVDKSKAYTLEYNDDNKATSNNKSILAPIPATYGKPLNTAKKKYTKTGYHYSKWYIYRITDGKTLYLCRDKATNKKESWYAMGKVPSDKKMVYLNVAGTLTINTPAGKRIYVKPVWEADKYTVNYNASGGQNAPAVQTKLYDQNLTLTRNVPARVGYAFQGWTDVPGGTTVKFRSGGTYTGNKSITFYAVWKDISYQVKTQRQLNKRKGPGTNYESVALLPKGSTVTVVETRNGWGRLSDNTWLGLKYTTKVDKSATTKATTKPTTKPTTKSTTKPAGMTKVTYQAKTTAQLNRRSGPGTNYKSLGLLEKGKTVSVIGTQNGWAKLADGSWVKAPYLAKIATTTKATTTKRVTTRTTTRATTRTTVNSNDFTVKIDAKGVAMRSSAKESGTIKGSVKKGGVYQIKARKGGWGQLRSNGYWIKLKYATIISGYRVKINIKDLSMRDGPGTSYKDNGYIKVATYQISKIDGDWGKVKSTDKSNGKWIYLGYTTRVK